ncbi:MAG TPA: hypothetical protein VG983_08900 [Caulobacterales bacterium]|nr:hypothetical protein [Caulobacterales bacterium]
MDSQPPPTASRRLTFAPRALRRLTLLLFVTFGLAYALFAQDKLSHNTLCRAAMTANMVEYGKVSIDGYEPLTTDIAFRGGHYYCDKAPGMSFLAAPAAFAFTRLAPVTYKTPFGRVWTVFLYLCGLTTSALLTASAAVLLFRYILDRTGQLGAAFVASLAFGLGTPVWGWATSFFSHAASAALLVFGYIALDTMVRRLAAGGSAALYAILGGLALGAAVAVEYTAFPATLIIGAGFLAISSWRDAFSAVKIWALAAAAATAALIPVLMFHADAFGSPFEAGYGYTVYYHGHQGGFFGVSLPRGDILAKLLVSGHYGVIWYAPILIAMIWAVWRLLRAPGQRMTAIVTILVAAWYLAMNAGFAYWDGGATTGPRYLTPALGFAAIALGLAWPHFGPWARRATGALLGLSILINFACTAVGMTAGSIFAEIPHGLFAADLRAAVTYQAFKHPGIIHFIAPLAAAALMAWLIAAQTRRLSAPSPG